MSRYYLIGVCALLLALIASCAPVPAPTGSAPTTAPAKAAVQKVLLVPQEQAEGLDFMLTREVGVMASMLEQAGYKVVVATASGKPLVGYKTTLNPDLKLADVKLDDYVGLIFPCMGVPLEPPNPSPEAVEIAKQAVAAGKPVAAQVGGVTILAAAHVLDGKRFAMVDQFKSLVPKGIYAGEGVVQDGNIITSAVCPMLAGELGKADRTRELTQKFIDTLASVR